MTINKSPMALSGISQEIYEYWTPIHCSAGWNCLSTGVKWWTLDLEWLFLSLNRKNPI
jgi:hypothetical protein